MSEVLSGFNDHMQAGMQAHAQGDYVLALLHRLEAYRSDPPQPEDRGRAARDIAASFDRIGTHTLGDTRDVSNAELSEAYAEYAYRAHKELMNLGNENGAREFTVSAMYMAINAARQNRGHDALTYIREGWFTSQSLAEKYDRTHQYDINIVGRYAGIEGLYGDLSKIEKRKLGKLAVSLASLSESNKTLGSNPNLSFGQVSLAQKKARRRGKAAKLIIAMESSPTRVLTRPIETLLLKKVVL